MTSSWSGQNEDNCPSIKKSMDDLIIDHDGHAIQASVRIQDAELYRLFFFRGTHFIVLYAASSTLKVTNTIYNF